jgi:hypothetical protein
VLAPPVLRANEPEPAGREDPTWASALDAWRSGEAAGLLSASR